MQPKILAWFFVAMWVAAAFQPKAPPPPVSPAYTYSCEIDPADVYDGDTITRVDIDLGFRIRTEQRVRLLGLDCPEIRPRNPDGKRTAADLDAEKAAAVAAREFVRTWLREHSDYVLQTRVDRSATDSFDRYLARIYGSKGDAQHCLNDDLLQAKHAKKFRETP